MPDARVDVDGLQVDQALYDLVTEEVLADTGVTPAVFWSGLAGLVADFTPRNRQLLARRDELQAQVDQWHRDNGAGTPARLHDFLAEVGYVVDQPDSVMVDPRDVDRELALVAGPQLVVPVDNARYALNAANARWGSLYDALYGTDALGDTPEPGDYDPQRGARVIAWARDFLDGCLPLDDGSWSDATGLSIVDGRLAVAIADDDATGLADPAQFVGHRGGTSDPDAVVCVDNGLHVELVVDRDHAIGATDAAGIADVVIESAVTTIADAEDSVAAVDAADKVTVYRHWLGLMTGTLETQVTKGGETFTRRLHPDREYVGPDGQPVVLPGRALLLVRHVGHHMTTPAVLDGDGDEVFEGLLDAMVTVAAALHDIGPGGRHGNSRSGSVYVVKPKMHGPEEVEFTVAMFERVEQVLGLAPATIKIGIMDEERRTTLNLPACIAAAADRVVFINTGFLDRTGDEIHTVMEAGPVVRKSDMKAQPWIDAYERWNVDVGLACGLAGRAQIGKGMWAMPDRMEAMLAEKVGHPRAGATTAWVPSPTAATLHATHYHEVDVAATQAELARREPATVEQLLAVPMGDPATWSDDDLARELADNLQGILGYVVRWVDQGVGCSTVPDVDGIGRMEDRATLRISSQLVANWLHHDVVTAEQVDAALVEMAAVVDGQNADDPAYRPMADDPMGSVAFRAARDLVMRGRAVANGYTEPVLQARRRERKAGAR